MVHPLVRDLYKRLLHAGKDYPLGLDFIRTKAKQYILKNKDLQLDSIEFRKAIAYGRFQVKEILAVNQLKKYRAMKSRYYAEEKTTS